MEKNARPCAHILWRGQIISRLEVIRMSRLSPSDFVVIMPSSIITIPQDSYLGYLPLFYALPKELVEKRPVYLNLPRNILTLIA